MGPSVTTQRLESCFSPLLDTKGYHGSPERQARGSKVALNCSIDGGQREGARDLKLPCDIGRAKAVLVVAVSIFTFIKLFVNCVSFFIFLFF